MPQPTPTIEQLLTMLEAGPGRIAGFAEGLTPAQLVAPPGAGEWSARDILAHLKSCSDVWGGYIVQILGEDRPRIKAVNPRTWIAQTDYREQEFQPLLEAFTAQRTELMGVLEPLGPEAWERMATVTGAGKPLELTVYSYAERIAVHERAHVKQIGRIADAMQR